MNRDEQMSRNTNKRHLEATLITFLLFFTLFSRFFLAFLLLLLLTLFCRSCLGFSCFSSLDGFLDLNLLLLDVAGVVGGEGASGHQVGAGLEATEGGPAKGGGSLAVATGDAAHAGEAQPGLLPFQQLPTRAEEKPGVRNCLCCSRTRPGGCRCGY